MQSCDLTNKTCTPCQGGVPPLAGEELAAYMKALDPAWELVDAHHLFRSYGFRDFREGLAFVNAVGELAEREGHHPDLTLSWGKVTLTLYTHKIDGLSESDFILAAKIDGI